MRAVGEGVNGFTVSASRTVDATAEELFAAFDDPATRERWLPGAELTERTTTPPRLARYDWRGGPSKVVVGIEALDDGRARVGLAHERLADAGERDRLKPWWRERLTALKQMLEAEARLGGPGQHASRGPIGAPGRASCLQTLCERWFARGEPTHARPSPSPSADPATAGDGRGPGGGGHAGRPGPLPRTRARPVTATGTLSQLRGSAGCMVNGPRPLRGCTPARALDGPGPFLGSRAIATSPDGRNVYVASSSSNAIAVFRRNRRTGRLTQGTGRAGCIAAKGAGGCTGARGLRGPNSVAVSPDGRTVYATSVNTDSVVILRRNSSTGALAQAKGPRGCVARTTMSGCAVGRELDGPDVVTVSPDGDNVYVGSFIGDAVVVFDRAASGALAQPAGTAGCLTNAPTSGCATTLALAAPEGMAVSGDGDNVYVASAVSDAVVVLARDDSTGALTQATDGSGCVTNAALTGCATGTQLAGANAVAVSADDDEVYVTSLTSNSLTTFDRTAGTGQLTQKTGTSACAINLLAVGCSLGRALSAPEGLTVSPDGASVYAAAFRPGALDSFNRSSAGALTQKRGRDGCRVAYATANCALGRGLRGTSSAVVSPDGRHLYTTAFASDAVAAFKRVNRGR